MGEAPSRSVRLASIALLMAALQGNSLRSHGGFFDTEIGRSPIVRSDGTTVGQMVVYRDLLTYEMDVSLTGLPPGDYTPQLADRGRCDRPAFASAGTDWTDLAKIHVDGSGNATQELTYSGPVINLGTPYIFDADGSALILVVPATAPKKGPARIACSVFPPDKK